VAVLIGAVAAYLQFTQQQQASSDQLKAAHDLFVSNQVSKGFEQLADKDSVVMRIGGIYALEGVMKTSLVYHYPVVEALRTFVRDSTTGNVNRKPRDDVQAALTVIGGRTEVAECLEVDLAGANIPGADLRYSNLCGFNFQGANLRGADMRHANLSMASLSGDNAAILDSGANLSGADLSGANLQQASLQRANLQGANLRGANMQDTNLSNVVQWGRNNYAYGPGGTNLSEADLSEALNLTQRQLDQACGKPKALPPGLTLDKPCPSRPAQ
jgi:uncharacterized protein YjbI with pentapeptide repeats